MEEPLVAGVGEVGDQLATTAVVAIEDDPLTALADEERVRDRQRDVLGPRRRRPGSTPARSAPPPPMTVSPEQGDGLGRQARGC